MVDIGKTAGNALAAIMICTAAACSRSGNVQFNTVYYYPVYAEGFEIIGNRDSESRVVRVRAQWQGNDSTASDLFLARGGELPPEGFTGQIVEGEAMRIAAMSSSHIAMLDLIGGTPRIKAVSGMRFISDSYIREHEDSIADIGSEADADFEKLVAARPDIVLLYGINSSSLMENRLRSLGIPFVYIGEYIEKSPLGRAEWVVAIAEIAGCREKGEAAFRQIENRYLTLKDRVGDPQKRPSVMLNVPYGETWFMASSGSSMAALLRDAGAEYVYSENSTNRTLPIDIEKALVLASGADFWLNVGNFRTIREITDAYPEFKGIGAITGERVYNCDKRLTEGGGNDFWESGQARPDLVLEDLIRIFHPETVIPERDAVPSGSKKSAFPDVPQTGRDASSGDDSLFYYRKLSY